MCNYVVPNVLFHHSNDLLTGPLHNSTIRHGGGGGDGGGGGVDTPGGISAVDSVARPEFHPLLGAMHDRRGGNAHARWRRQLHVLITWGIPWRGHFAPA